MAKLWRGRHVVGAPHGAGVLAPGPGRSGRESRRDPGRLGRDPPCQNHRRRSRRLCRGRTPARPEGPTREGVGTGWHRDHLERGQRRRVRGCVLAEEPHGSEPADTDISAGRGNSAHSGWGPRCHLRYRWNPISGHEGTDRENRTCSFWCALSSYRTKAVGSAAAMANVCPRGVLVRHDREPSHGRQVD